MGRAWKWIAVVAVVLVVAAGFGLIRADFGRTTNAEAETTVGMPCPAGQLELSAPATVPVNSSAIISAQGWADSCAYKNVTIVTIAFGDKFAGPAVNLNPSGAGTAIAYATLNGFDYQVGDTVQVSAALTSNSGTPEPVVQTQTVTIAPAGSSDATVTVQVPTQPVVAGQPFTIGGQATNVNPAMYPNGINLNVLLDGSVIATSTLLNESSGAVSGTVSSTTAGQHVVEVQLTTGVGAAAATAQQNLTVAAN